MKIEASTDEEFFINSGKWEELIRAADKKITALVGDLDRQLYHEKSITLLGYGSMNYKKNKKWPLISIAPQKSFVSIYFSAYKDDVHILEHHRNTLEYCAFGKGCIKFNKKEFLDQKKFDNVILETVEYYHTYLQN
jgi:hypothetical protein